MKSGLEETTSAYEDVSFPHQSKDESSSLKISSRNKTSEISMSVKSFCVPSYVDGFMPCDDGEYKSPPRINATSELDQKCFDSHLRKRYIKSTNEENHSKFYSADASNETSCEKVSSLNVAGKHSTKLSARSGICEITNLERPSRSKITERIWQFGDEGKHSLAPTIIFCGKVEKYSGSTPYKRQRNFASEKTHEFPIFDACNKMASLEKRLSSSKRKDVSLSENESFRNNTTSHDLSFDVISSQSEMPSTSRQRRKSEGDDPHELFTAKDSHYKTQFLENMGNHLLISKSNESIGLTPAWSKEDEINDMLFKESFNHRFLYSSMSSDAETGDTRPEFNFCDDMDSSSCSSLGGYYDDDEDLQRFCVQDKLTLQDQASSKEEIFILNENHEESNSITSNSSLDRKCETPICKFTFKEEDSSEGYLLMQVEQFFSEKVLIVDDTMSWQERKNIIIKTKYFTDEFAQQHGLTVIENEMDVIRNTLGDNADECDRRYREDDSFIRRFVKPFERSPIAILTTVLKLYMSLYNTYSY